MLEKAVAYPMQCSVLRSTLFKWLRSPRVKILLVRVSATSILPFVAACSRTPAPIADAQIFLAHSPAFQADATTLTVITRGGRESRNEITSHWEIVRGGPLHVKELADGKPLLDLTTDGKRQFWRNEDGSYEEVHGDAPAAYKGQAARVSAVLLGGPGGYMRRTRHGDIDGTTASVYTWMPLRGWLRPLSALPPLRWVAVLDQETLEVWLGDGDHRPLKSEHYWRKENNSYAGGRLAITMKTTFHYDAAVRVSLPRIASDVPKRP